MFMPKIPHPRTSSMRRHAIHRANTRGYIAASDAHYRAMGIDPAMFRHPHAPRSAQHRRNDKRRFLKSISEI